MQRFLRALPAVVLWGLGTVLVAREPDGDPLDRFRLGGLRIGLGEAAVIAALGQPAEKSAEVEEAASGFFVTDWAWPGQGVWITMGSEAGSGPKEVHRVQVRGPGTLKTGEGIGLGARAAAVLAAYRDQLDPETPPTERLIVAGSIYGGLLFTLEKGVVTEIFLGAAAE